MIIILILLVALCVYFRYSRRGILASKIPGPLKLPIFGNCYTALKNPDKLFKHMRTFNKTYGDIICFTVFNTTIINIYHPDDIEKVFSSTRFTEKQNPYNFLKPWLGEGMLTSNGMKWHKRRKMLTRAFHFKILQQYVQTFAEQTEEFMELLKTESKNQKSDIIKLITDMTLKTMCETAMGISAKGKENVTEKYFKALHKFGRIIQLRVSRIWYYYDILFQFTKEIKYLRSAVQDLHYFTNNIIKERKEYLKKNLTLDETSGKGKLAMLDLLIQNESKGEIDSVGIREEVDTFLFEGHDTTATALIFFIMKIANEKTIQDKIYEEIKNVLGNSTCPATYNDLNNMKYLECCIKESLRLYPSVPYVARYIDEETVLGGYTIPSGTIVQLNTYDVHRRPDSFPEPERFIPERFMTDNRHPYSYMPFSAGPRNCIGQKFAMLEMKMLISSLLRSYRLEPVTKDSDLVFVVDIVLRTNHPIYVRFRPRH